MKHHYDIIIAGGGMVGLVFAALLANTSLSLAIIESNAPDVTCDLTNYDLRVSALNPKTKKILMQLGLWNTLVQMRVSTFDKLFVWVDNAPLEFSANLLNSPELGFIVENRVLRHVLWQAVSQQRNVTLLCSETITEIEITDQVSIKTQQNPYTSTDASTDASTYTSNLIIGAEGVNSWLRQTLALPLVSDDYQQTALVTTVKTEQPHQQTAWQHFLPEGPLALLPLSDPHYCSIVWTTTAAKAEQLKIMATDDFNQAITTAFEKRLGGMTVQAPRLTFPLTMQHLKNYVLPHIAFIGDAAHRIHPLAGQGLNLGFMDALCLASKIKQVIKDNTNQESKDIANLRLLKSYQRERKYYNGQMIGLMKLLNNLFRTTSPTLATLRNRGMTQLNALPLLKRFFVI